MGGLGILGGTFNPPHNGHLASARYAHRQLGLERVLLMPVHSPPHKQVGEDPGPEHRLAMCRLAADGDETLAVCTLEVDRGGASYTADTLRAVHAKDPDVELTFIVGADMVRTLPQWREPREVVRLAQLAVAERDGAAQQQIREALAPLDCDERVVFLDMPRIDVSSSLVRERLAAGQPIEDLVAPAVAEYIARHELYRAPAEKPATPATSR